MPLCGKSGSLGILRYCLWFAAPNPVEFFKKFFLLSAGLLDPANFFVQVALAGNFGILQRVSPAAQLFRDPFRKQFQI